MSRIELKIIEIFNSYDRAIKEKLVNDLAKSYSQLLIDIDNRGVVRSNTFEYPRLNYFLKSLFFHLFEKLHKGNKEEALKLISELKVQSSFASRYLNNNSVPDSIRDDTSFASEEFKAILCKYDEVLRTELKNLIVDIYNKAIIEINSKNIVHRSGNSQPRLEKFLISAFCFVFEKLHKGDKSKAREIMNNEIEKLIEIEYDNRQIAPFG